MDWTSGMLLAHAATLLHELSNRLEPLTQEDESLIENARLWIENLKKYDRREQSKK